MAGARSLLRLFERGTGTMPRSLLASLAVHAGIGAAFGLGLGTGVFGGGPRREIRLTLESDPVTLPLPEEREPPATVPILTPDIPVELPPMPEEPLPPLEPTPIEPPPVEPPDEEPQCELPVPLPVKTWFTRLEPVRPPVLAAPPQDAPRPAQAAEPVPIAADNEPPRYPALAIRQHLEGTAIVLVQVDALGKVVHCEIDRSSGHGLLDRAALAALARWRFRGGPGTTRVPVVFRLTDR